MRFGGVIGCENLRFDILRGEILGLIGPNGAGKTSAVNAITGVYTPEPGASVVYSVDGHVSHELVGLRPHQIVRLGIARTLQNLGLFPSLDVVDNLLLGRYIHQKYGVLSSAAFTRACLKDEVLQRSAVKRIMDLLQIGVLGRVPVGTLPYGLQKRIELGRALAMEPDVLLLDEPLAGMAREEREDIVHFVNRAREELNVSVLVIEHDMAAVMSMADRVMVLDGGSVLAKGSPADVQQNPQVIDAYLGV